MTTSYAEFVRRFVTVARTGSIQGAARTLNLSQPSLTQSVRRIEDLFGCRLFDRTKKGVLLTPMGERLFLRSTRMLEEEALARAEIEDMLSGRNSHLRLSAGTAWGYGFLPGVIRELQTLYPELTINLDIALTSDALPQLQAGRIDAFLGADAGEIPDSEGMARRPLVEIEYAAACGAHSPLTARPTTLRELAAYPVIVYDDDAHLMKTVISDIERRIGAKLRIAVQTRSLLASLELARTGPYVVFAGRPSLTRIARQEVRIVDLQEPLHRFPTSIYFRRTLMHSPPFRTLLEVVKEIAEDDQTVPAPAANG